MITVDNADVDVLIIRLATLERSVVGKAEKYETRKNVLYCERLPHEYSRVISVKVNSFDI